jgi:hypothetical protein
VRALDLLGEPAELVGVGLEHDGADLAAPGALGGAQRLDQLPRCPQRLGQPVGDREDALVGTAIDGERVGGSGRSVRGGEVAAESQDVGDRRAAPPVDRLVRVADGGHRMTAAVRGAWTREQAAQQLRLGDRCVLVLVEEHDAELVALAPSYVGMLAGEARGERDLIGKVDQSEPALQRTVRLDEAEQLRAPVEGVEDALDLGPLCLARLMLRRLGEPAPLPVLKRPDVVGADEMLAHRRVEGQHVVDDGRGVIAEQPDRAGVAADRARGQLVARRIGEHARVGFVTDPQALLGEQRGGVRVVRRHRRLQRLLGCPLGVRRSA